jgi:long-chain fatty acid transport protein
MFLACAWLGLAQHILVGWVMSFRGLKAVLLACGGVAALIAATADANAGGFAIREQSAYGQGSSFAGIAAGGALSSMFWNPATMTQFAGKNYEFDGSMIFPHASHTSTTSTLTGALCGGTGLYCSGVDNSGSSAIVPSSYSSWQLSDRFWIGMSTNAPFGLGVTFPRTWAGAGYAQDSRIETYNFAPSVAYKINDWISVGAGVQVQYMRVSYDTLTTAFPVGWGTISGSGWGYGFTAGVTLTPMPATVIGIGYRSAIDQKINGNMELSSAVPASTRGPVDLTLNLPDMVTVGLRQGIGDRFTLLAGFEWSNWSRIGTANLNAPAGPATIGGTVIKFPFQYSDGYFYSLGGEYIVDPSLTVRAGIAFEQSPITDSVRTPRLPDNDRMWYSVGASYKHPQFKGLTFDLAYTYIDVKDTPINISAASGNPWLNATGTFIGSVDEHVHIIALAARYQWDAAAPVKTK